jgi:hypothetical protein
MIVLGAAVSTPSAEPAAGDLEGETIVSIVFVRNDVFDTTRPETSKWFYRAANSLHIVSKEPFIRSMLLFEEGEPFSRDLADESARLLRSLGFMNPVNIAAAPVEGGVEVTVETTDQWTLEVGGSLGVFGNQSGWGLEFQESNFLGRGKKLDVEYETDVERDTVSVGYFDPNIRGTRWRADLRYSDLSDGFLERVHLDRPFYALDVRRAWGGLWERGELTEYLYSEAEKAVSGPARNTTVEAWYGWRFPSPRRITRRISVGFRHDHTTFGDWFREGTLEPYPKPDDRLIDGPSIRYEQVTDDFQVVQGFRAWSIQEDVALGPNFSIGAVASLPAFGGDVDRLVLDSRIDVGLHRGRWLVLGDAWLSGRIDDGKGRNVLGGVSVGVAQLGERGFQFRALYEDSYRLDRDRQLTLGAEEGLRGWSPLYFDGTGRALVNAQWRTLLVPNLFQILTVGFVTFVDAGLTWDPQVGRDTDGVRADVGVGLTLDLTTIGLSNVARVEVGFPDDGSGATVIVTTSALF